MVSEVMNGAALEDSECASERLSSPRNATFMRDIRTYHIDGEDLGTLAETAAVGTLMLPHFVPTIDDAVQAGVLFRLPVEATYSGELILSEDGSEVVLSIAGE